VDSFNRVVQNMMARFAGPAVLSIAAPGDGEYNVETSEYVPAPPTSWPVRAMVFDYTLQSNGTQTQPGTLIQVGDKQVFVAPPPGMPRVRPERDSLIVGDKKFKIITYKELNPTQSYNVLIELFVRA
jgi:hypothetical protein